MFGIFLVKHKSLLVKHKSLLYIMRACVCAYAWVYMYRFNKNANIFLKMGISTIKCAYFQVKCAFFLKNGISAAGFAHFGTVLPHFMASSVHPSAHMPAPTTQKPVYMAYTPHFMMFLPVMIASQSHICRHNAVCMAYVSVMAGNRAVPMTIQAHLWA